MSKIIITVSGEAGHGKDTVCNIMRERLTQIGKTNVRIAYADYLKHLAKVLYDWDGRKDNYGRTLLQNIGNNVRQKNPDFWVSIVEQTVDAAITEQYVIIPDTRYPNEIEFWKNKGYDVVTVRVHRPNYDNGLTQKQKQHPSETALNGYSYDYVINNTSYTDLEEQVNDVLTDIRRIYE